MISIDDLKRLVSARHPEVSFETKDGRFLVIVGDYIASGLIDEHGRVARHAFKMVI